MKKQSGGIIILHRCTINDNHMMYGSRDTQHNRIFCHFGPFFAFLSLQQPKKSKLKKKKKTISGDIIILHMYTTDDNQIMYGS